MINETNKEKDLGVVLTRNMKDSVQCRKAAIRETSILGMMYRSFEHKDRNMIMTDFI